MRVFILPCKGVATSPLAGAHGRHDLDINSGAATGRYPGFGAGDVSTDEPHHAAAGAGERNQVRCMLALFVSSAARA